MKQIILILASIMLLGSCNGISFDGGETAGDVRTKKFTFTMKGDFDSQWKPFSTLRFTAFMNSVTQALAIDEVRGSLA